MGPLLGMARETSIDGDAMAESLRTRLLRARFNLFPAYRGTGGRITYIRKDFREVRVKIPLNWRTRNYVGTTFGGSLYGAVDPIYMVMLIQNLGPDFVVWDKSASIRFRKPGRTTLYGHFLLKDGELDAIRGILASQPSTDRTYIIEVTDEQGAVHAVVEKKIHVRPTS